MSIITSGNFPKTLRPGLKVIFNTEQKDKRQYHLDIFTKVDSDKQYEERMGMVGMGVARTSRALACPPSSSRPRSRLAWHCS